MTYEVYMVHDHRLVTEPPEFIGRFASQRAAHRAAARALGCRNLRGLRRFVTEEGWGYSAPGGDEDDPAVYINVCGPWRW